MFIIKTNLKSDIPTVKQNLKSVLQYTDWEPMNQIGLNHRVNAVDPWTDAAGSLYDRTNKIQLGNETDFTVWNTKCPNYIRDEIIKLSKQEQVKIGRVRFMRLKPKTGLSVHKDAEYRYHLVLETNNHSYICQQHKRDSNLAEVPIQSVCYQIPCDGYWYLVDTTQTHYVYNGGSTDRIHIVVCAIK